MSVTPSSPFKQETQITEATFVHELKKKGALDSPLFNGSNAPNDLARHIYRHIVEKGHSAEVWLGICGKEHTWGTNPNSVLHRGDTRSWTNARSVRHPGLSGWTMYHDPNRDSQYVKYESVLDSVMDGIYRVEDPDFDYQKANATTIGEVISIWAPAEDENNPEGYAWWIANYVEGLRSRETPIVTGGDFSHIPWIPADSRHYTKGRTVQHPWPDRIILHHTDGWDSLNWLTKSPNSNVSATLLLNHDGTPRAQLVRLKDTPHTTLAQNPRSITIEWERRWTGTTEQRNISDSQYRNIAQVVVDIVIAERARGNPHFKVFDPQELTKHNDYYDTICPGNLKPARVFEIASRMLNQTQPDRPDIRMFPETGRVMVHGFKALFEQMELYNGTLPYRVLGLPRTHEGWALMADESKRRVQFMERSVLVWNQDAESPWDVTTMHREEVDQIVMFSEDEAA